MVHTAAGLGRTLGKPLPHLRQGLRPPKIKCIECYEDMNDWVKLPGTGTLETYTVVHYEEPIHPKKAPLIYGVIKLDGADTGIAHLIDEVEPDQVKVGMRMEMVLAEEREANIMDIKYFRPIRMGVTNNGTRSHHRSRPDQVRKEQARHLRGTGLRRHQPGPGRRGHHHRRGRQRGHRLLRLLGRQHHLHHGHHGRRGRFRQGHHTASRATAPSESSTG